MSLYYLLAILFVFVRRSHAGHPGHLVNARPETVFYESTTPGPQPPGMNIPTLITSIPTTVLPPHYTTPLSFSFSAPIMAQLRDHPHIHYHTKHSHLYSPRGEAHTVVHSYSKESYSNTAMVLRSNDVSSILSRILPPDDFFDNIRRNILTAVSWRDRSRRQKVTSARAKAHKRKNT
ncbi:hypothetical protein Y032_0116g598 [Ancylostoma ceylanicum]|nr:hypothetical protein Y032_0116g598 [Ancylostoma ceylanicum]